MYKIKNLTERAITIGNGIILQPYQATKYMGESDNRLRQLSDMHIITIERIDDEPIVNSKDTKKLNMNPYELTKINLIKDIKAGNIQSIIDIDNSIKEKTTQLQETTTSSKNKKNKKK